MCCASVGVGCGVNGCVLGLGALARGVGPELSFEWVRVVGVETVVVTDVRPERAWWLGCCGCCYAGRRVCRFGEAAWGRLGMVRDLPVGVG